MAYRDFTKMQIWSDAFELLNSVYNAAAGFPKNERYILTQQLLRSANSVIHNVAEGFGRFENRDKTRFYKISRGSAYEAISQLLVAKRRKYAEQEMTDRVIQGYMSCITQLVRLIIHLEGRAKG